MEKHFYLAAICSLMLATASLADGPATALSTAPTTRTADGISADLNVALQQFYMVIDQGNAVQTAATRKAAAAMALPALKKILSLLDELGVAQPQLKDQFVASGAQYQVFLLIFGDPDQQAAYTKKAACKGSDAAAARAMLAVAAFVKADGAVPAENRAIDDFDAAMKAAPDNPVIYGLIGFFSLTGEPSREVSSHLVKVLKADAANPEVQQFAAMMEAHLKLRLMEDKPLVIAGARMDGTNFSSADWKGKVILVDFWATWSGPSVESLARVKRMYADYHAKGLEIVGVSCDQSGDDLKGFLSANPDMTWPQLFQQKTAGWHPLATGYGITDIPTMFLIDRKGILRTVEADLNMEAMIPKLLAEKP